jgi:hypothetical protein
VLSRRCGFWQVWIVTWCWVKQQKANARVGKDGYLYLVGLCCEGVERLPTGYPRLSILRAKNM